jgi:cyclohexane-1-carboxylate hydroxylase
MQEAPDTTQIDWPAHLGPYDPNSHAIQADPYPHYAFMRKHAPVVKAKTPAGDLWFVSRFNDVQNGLRDSKRLSNAVVDPDKLRIIVLMDPPRHSRLRALVSGSFTPKAVAAFEQQLQTLFHESFDPVLAKRSGDISREFAERMALGTIGKFLGISTADFEGLKDLSTRLHNYVGRVARHAPGTDGDEEGFLAMLEILRGELKEAQRTPKDTIIGKFAEYLGQGLLEEDDFLHFCAFLFQAGQETTSILISAGFMILAEQPELIGRLRENPNEMGRFIEELARLRAAPQKLARLTAEDIEVAGFKIPANAQVKLLPGSANRDETKFPNGEVFDINRDPSGHLGFGYGLHTCLGMWLARLELKTVFTSVVNSVSKIELSPNIPIVPYTGGAMLFTGPSSVHVELSARATV